MKVIMNECEYCEKLFEDTIEGFARYNSHIKVHKVVTEIEIDFPKPPYLNNEQCILRRKEWLEVFKERISAKAIELYPECENQSLSFYFGRVNEDSPFRKIVYRLDCICNYCGREWNQPYNAQHCRHLAAGIDYISRT